MIFNSKITPGTMTIYTLSKETYIEIRIQTKEERERVIQQDMSFSTIEYRLWSEENHVYNLLENELENYEVIK